MRLERHHRERLPDNALLFGPMGVWRCFRFTFALRRRGVRFWVCRNPRCVAVQGEDLGHAGMAWENVTRGVWNFGQGAE